MANYLVTDTELTSVANAIRARGDTSASLAFPTGFVSAIENIPTGGTNVWARKFKIQNNTSAVLRIRYYSPDTPAQWPSWIQSGSVDGLMNIAAGEYGEIPAQTGTNKKGFSYPCGLFFVYATSDNLEITFVNVKTMKKIVVPLTWSDGVNTFWIGYLVYMEPSSNDSGSANVGISTINIGPKVVET